MDLPKNALLAAVVATRLKLSRRHVGHLCRLKVFPGAVKLPGATGQWLIPAASLPSYARWCEKHAGKAGRPPKGPPSTARRG